MTKERLIREFQAKIANKLPAEDVMVATGALISLLREYDVTEHTEALAVVDEYNIKLIKMYTACLTVGGKSDKTVEGYGRELMKFDEFLEGKKFCDVSAIDVRMYLGMKKVDGVSNRTLENVRAYLAAFFQWMCGEEIISKNPMLNVKPVKCEDVDRLPFSEAEIIRLRNACGTAMEKAMVETLLSTGVRVSELCALNVSDINLNNNTVRIINGKGGKNRTTFISESAARCLKEYLAERGDIAGELFRGQRGRFTASGVRKILYKIGEIANVEDVHPHRFRRTFATKLATGDAPLQSVATLMGHASLDTTMLYVTMDEAKMHSEYNKAM